MVGPDTLEVDPPQRKALETLEGLPLGALFLLAALYRHETLTAREAAEVVELSAGLTERILVRAVQQGLLTELDGDYQVSSLWYAPLARYLKRKNYLYGR